MNLPFGMIALLVTGIAVYFGIAQRVLDRMKLTDRGAILFILAMAAGSFLTIPLLSGRVNVTLNIGGALLPVMLAVWLIFKAERMKERIRALMAAVGVVGIVYLGSIFMPSEPETMFIDPKLFYGLSAGIAAWLLGRSRRSAFAGGVLGIVGSDIIHTLSLLNSNRIGTTAIGGAGAFDVVILTGITAVLCAEFIGEFFERIAHFQQHTPHTDTKLHPALTKMEASQEISPPNIKKTSIQSSRVVSLHDKRTDKKRGDSNGNL